MSRMLLHLRLWRSCWPPPPAAFDQHLHIPAAGGGFGTPATPAAGGGGDFSTPATLPAAAGVASLQTQLQISSLTALCRASKMSPTPTFRAHSQPKSRSRTPSGRKGASAVGPTTSSAAQATSTAIVPAHAQAVCRLCSHVVLSGEQAARGNAELLRPCNCAAPVHRACIELALASSSHHACDSCGRTFATQFSLQKAAAASAAVVVETAVLVPTAAEALISTLILACGVGFALNLAIIVVAIVVPLGFTAVVKTVAGLVSVGMQTAADVLELIALVCVAPFIAAAGAVAFDPATWVVTKTQQLGAIYFVAACLTKVAERVYAAAFGQRPNRRVAEYFELSGVLVAWFASSVAFSTVSYQRQFIAVAALACGMLAVQVVYAACARGRTVVGGRMEDYSQWTPTRLFY